MPAQRTRTSTFTVEDFLVHVDTGDRAALYKISCHWSLSDRAPRDEHGIQYFHCINLWMRAVLWSCDGNVQGEANGIGDSLVPCPANTTLEHLVNAYYKIQKSPAQDTFSMTAKIILVSRGGYLGRKDILEFRMRHSEYIEAVIPFPTADGYFPPAELHGETSLAALIVSSPGALIVREYWETEYHESSNSLDQDINVRLSFNWVLSTKPPNRRVAMVGGRAMFDQRKMSFCYEGPYEAARALDISVIVVDKPGHWLQEDTFSHLRDEFVAVDITIDEGLPARIAEAVKDKKLDGIVAFADEFVDATVQAAVILDLPTEPVSAYLQCLDKYTTRQLFSQNAPALRLDSSAQLHDESMSSTLESLPYPMVVKPCRGAGSRGVSKVNNLASLREAVGEIERDGYSKQGILIESYADGPEVDANFALWEGEILFFEMCDDFPCPADAEDATVSDSFAEDIMVLPSHLDPAERELVRSSLHRVLLQLGFRPGVFHVEARMQNSTMRYQTMNGIVDLGHVHGSSTTAESRRPPEVFLLEVNPRAAGPQSVYATAYTYGVDFYALQWLRALSDGQRFAALCHPFACDAQYCSSIVLIPVHRENLRIPDDYCDDVLGRVPEVAPYVSRAECFTPGKTVSPVGGAGFLAYFLVYSRTSRRYLLEMCDRIKKVSREVLDGL